MSHPLSQEDKGWEHVMRSGGLPFRIFPFPMSVCWCGTKSNSMVAKLPTPPWVYVLQCSQFSQITFLSQVATSLCSRPRASGTQGVLQNVQKNPGHHPLWNGDPQPPGHLLLPGTVGSGVQPCDQDRGNSQRSSFSSSKLGPQYAIDGIW